MNIENERELFEKLQSPALFERIQFSKSKNCYIVKSGYFDDLITNAECHKLNFGWDMWQASANREGFVLVGKELTEQSINKFYETWDDGAKAVWSEMLKSQENKDE